MKHVREDDELFRLSLKPTLTPEEESRLEALLAARPDRAAGEEDRALGRALQALPDVPLSSNFTARVLQAVDLESARAERAQQRPRFHWLTARWWRLAGGGVVAALALLAWQGQRLSKQTTLARDASFVVRDLAALPGPEVMRDFDVIDQLRQVPTATDDDLLAALQ